MVVVRDTSLRGGLETQFGNWQQQRRGWGGVSFSLPHSTPPVYNSVANCQPIIYAKFFSNICYISVEICQTESFCYAKWTLHMPVSLRFFYCNQCQLATLLCKGAKKEKKVDDGSNSNSTQQMDKRFLF